MRRAGLRGTAPASNLSVPWRGRKPRRCSRSLPAAGEGQRCKTPTHESARQEDPECPDAQEPGRITSGIERTPKGKLWACWVAGGDSPKAFFVLATSDDQGETWSKPRLVIDTHSPKLPFDRSVLVGNLWTDPRGRLWIAEAVTYPRRAPEGEGKDDIVVFEDRDHDGSFEHRTVFVG